VFYIRRITVLTADVISSRKAGLDQHALAALLRDLTHPALLVPFTVSRGDEIQGVMDGWLSAPQLVRMLRWRCRPLQLRIGLGLGCHSGALEPDPWKMSGPAFYRARQALESVEGKQPGTRVVTGNDRLDPVANSLLLLLDTLMARWTEGQWQAVMTYEQAGTFAQAGEILGVAAQNVQKRCKAAYWNQVRQAEEGLSRIADLVPAGHPESGDSAPVTSNTVREGC